jgi:hypothetical protein
MTTIILAFLAGFGWTSAVVSYIAARRRLGAYSKKLVDEMMGPALEKARADIGTIASDHAIKLAESYAHHAGEMARLLQPGTRGHDDWTGRAAGAREVAAAIRKTRDNLFGPWQETKP